MAARAPQKLSSRERIRTAVRREEPDRVPVFLDIAIPLALSSTVRWRTPFERAKVLLELGADPIIFLWLPDPVIDSAVQVNVARERRGDGTIVLTKQFDTPRGPLRQVVEETPDWCDAAHGFWVHRTLGTTLREEYGVHLLDDWNVSRRREPWVKGRDDLAKLPYVLRRPARWQLEEWRHDAERAMEFADRYGLYTMARRTIVCDAFAWFCDIPWFLMQVHDDPEFVGEFLRIFEQIADWQMDVALDLKPDCLQHRDWYAGPEFWGPAHHERYLMPWVNRAADRCRAAGVEHCYLLTEGWGPYLELFRDLRSGLLWGADPLKGGAPLAEVKRRLGGTHALLGGVNAELQIGLDPEAARTAARAAIRDLAPGGGFILGVSSSIGIDWPSSSLASIEAVIDEAHTTGRYPLSG